IGVRILPGLMHRFAPSWPGIELRPAEAESDLELYELVERGEVELAFVELPAPPGPFETMELYADPYVLVLQGEHPLARSARTPRSPSRTRRSRSARSSPRPSSRFAPSEPPPGRRSGRPGARRAARRRPCGRAARRTRRRRCPGRCRGRAGRRATVRAPAGSS